MGRAKIVLQRTRPRGTGIWKVVLRNVRGRHKINSPKHIEKLGMYYGTPDARGRRQIHLDQERVKYWISAGCQWSESVGELLNISGLIPPEPVPNTTTGQEYIQLLKEHEQLKADGKLEPLEPASAHDQAVMDQYEANPWELPKNTVQLSEGPKSEGGWGVQVQRSYFNPLPPRQYPWMPPDSQLFRGDSTLEEIAYLKEDGERDWKKQPRYAEPREGEPEGGALPYDRWQEELERMVLYPGYHPEQGTAAAAEEQPVQPKTNRTQS